MNLSLLNGRSIMFFDDDAPMPLHFSLTTNSSHDSGEERREMVDFFDDVCDAHLDHTLRYVVTKDVSVDIRLSDVFVRSYSYDPPCLTLTCQPDRLETLLKPFVPRIVASLFASSRLFRWYFRLARIVGFVSRQDHIAIFRTTQSVQIAQELVVYLQNDIAEGIQHHNTLNPR